jgi:hypothetical protein
LIYNELISVRKKFKPINSGHEGYAIIKEEIEELQENIIDIEYRTVELWENVKNNKTELQLDSINKMYKTTIEIIKETIQVAAMCKRFEKDLGIKNVGQ